MLCVLEFLASPLFQKQYLWNEEQDFANIITMPTLLKVVILGSFYCFSTFCCIILAVLTFSGFQGDSSVGKSSLMNRFVNNEFDRYHQIFIFSPAGAVNVHLFCSIHHINTDSDLLHHHL